MGKKNRNKDPDGAGAAENAFFPAVSDVASDSDFTGLMPTPPRTESEKQAYRKLAAVELPDIELDSQDNINL